MKCLSIKQPWADFICRGKKSIEIRKWQSKYRGPVLIHAGKKVDEKACKHFEIDPAELYTGGIIGVATLSGIIETKDLAVVWDVVRDDSLEYTDYEEGKVGWVFTRQKMLETPIACKGQLGLFDYEFDDE